jgi:hypothetical protein
METALDANGLPHGAGRLLFADGHLELRYEHGVLADLSDFIFAAPPAAIDVDAEFLHPDLPHATYDAIIGYLDPKTALIHSYETREIVRPASPSEMDNVRSWRFQKRST